MRELIMLRMFKQARNKAAEQLAGENKVMISTANKIAEILNQVISAYSKQYPEKFYQCVESSIDSRVQDSGRPKGEKECLRQIKENFMKSKEFDAIDTLFALRHLFTDGVATPENMQNALMSTISSINSAIVKARQNQPFSESDVVISNGLSAIREYFKDIAEAPENIDKNKTVKGVTYENLDAVIVTIEKELSIFNQEQVAQPK